MKYRLFIGILLVGSLLMLTSCFIDERETANASLIPSEQIPTESESGELRLYRPVVSNDIPFVYDGQSDITIDGLSGLSTKSELHYHYPMTAIHKNEGEYYTIYSLKSGGLAYVKLKLLTTTGVDFMIFGIVEYPYKSPEQEQELWFLLPQDCPEFILGLNTDE